MRLAAVLTLAVAGRVVGAAPPAARVSPLKQPAAQATSPPSAIHHPGAHRGGFLREAAFYEKEGQLEITDTTLRLGNAAFLMDKARYQATLAMQLGDQAPIEYRYKNHRLAFMPTGLGWARRSGERIPIRQGVQPVPGRLVTNSQLLEGSDDPELAHHGLIYENAYGEGLHLGVLTKNLVFRKTVRFDERQSLGEMPADAELLEVEFELQTDEGTFFRSTFGGEEVRLWDKKETVIARGEPVEFGKGEETSLIPPAHAWDSAGGRIPLDLEFRSEGGRLFLRKLIPTAWLKRAVFPVFADVDLTFGIEAAYNSADTGRMSVTPLDATHVVIAYEDTANGSFGTAVVGTISGKTISFGPEWVFNPASTVVVRLSATTLDSSHVVIAYWDVGNSKTAIVGTISGTTITFGSEYVFQGPAGTTGGLAATALDGTHVAIIYQDVLNASFGTAIVGTISGGNVITFGATYVFRAGTTNFPSGAALDSTHFVAAYRAGGAGTPGTAIVGTVSSGDVIAYGPASVFNPADTGAITPTRLDDTHVLIAYGDTGNSGFGTAIAGTVSGGNNLTFGSEVVYNPSANNGYNVATTLDSNHVAIAFAGSSAASNGVAVIGTISGANNICFGPLFDYDTGSISNPSARALDATRVVITYRDDGTTFGTAILGEVSTLQRLIGFETVSGIQEMISLSLDSGFQSTGVRPGSGGWFLEQATGPSTLTQGLATCEGKIGVRFSFRKPANPPADQVLLQFINGATNLWSLRLRTDGRLQVQQDQVLGLTTTAGTTVLADNVWYTVRLVYDRAAGGVLKVWLATNLQIDATHSAAGTTVDGILVSGPAFPNGYHYDDFSITDSTAPPTFGQIVERLPMAPGNLTQFDTPSPLPAHWDNVDEPGPITTDFNQHAASSLATDLYALADSPVGAINAVKGMWEMSRSGGPSAGGTHDYAWRENGVNRSAAFAGLGTSFTTKEVVWQTPPNSGGPWTSAKFDALELGASHNGTQGQDTLISWTTAMVDYNDGSTTAVTLGSFTATGHHGEVLLEWQTASELSNLGFHVYRSLAAEGPYERITSSLIPGLGSSPTGASYSYRDNGVQAGQTYFYKLEDVETTGRTELHGPVWATPMPADGAGGGGSGDGSDPGAGPARIPYGRPEAASFRIVERGSRYALLELLTPGFYAVREGDGAVRLEVPGFESGGIPGAPDVPVKRVLVEALVGRRVDLTSVVASEEIRFHDLRVAPAEAPAIVVTDEGTVEAGRVRKEGTLGPSLFPRSQARVLEVIFQGETKNARLELGPLRYNPSTGMTVLTQRLLVRLDFTGVERGERTLGGSRGRRPPLSRPARSRGLVAELVTPEAGLHALRYEDVFSSPSGVSATSLRLSRRGQSVAFRIEPPRAAFAPGSVLYFVSEGAKVNPWGDAVYELEVGNAGTNMPALLAAPTGSPTMEYLDEKEWEENHYYQAGLLEALDLWQWDVLVSPITKSYPFTLSQLSHGHLSRRSTTAHLRVWLQGASDFNADPDHHLRVSLNGQVVGEATWDGKVEKVIEAGVDPGILQEGANTLSLENVGDTAASYSMVFLNRFSLTYPRRLVAEGGLLRGAWHESGTAAVSNVSGPGFVLDVQDPLPQWLLGVEAKSTELSFRAEAGRKYLVVSAASVKTPVVRRPLASRLRTPDTGADWLLVAPQEFLGVAQPLVELRRSQGLEARAVSMEEVEQEFGNGEHGPSALKAFLEYAYQSWPKPSPRYVVLLGDGSYDPKDYLHTGVKDRIPPYMLKTSYLWTASDPAYGAVNGEDLVPDIAVGRLSAGSLEQAQLLVDKVVAFEAAGRRLDGGAVLVADNADMAGNFEADADEIASSVLSRRELEKVYLRDLGAGTRAAIVAAFDSGPSLVSYLGHGGTAVWASENVFNTTDVARLSAQAQQPLLLTLNCLNGFFHFPPLDSLAEAFVKAPGKGAVAAFAPSGLSIDSAAHLYHKTVLSEIESGRHARLGDAILAAQVTYSNSGALPELLSIYHLLGDPALEIR